MTAYVPDWLYRTEYEVTADGFRQYAYDGVDNVRAVTDRDGRVTQFDYDDKHRLKREEWLGPQGNVQNFFDFSYDNAGQLRSATENGGATVSYLDKSGASADSGRGYDDLGRVTREEIIYPGTPVPTVVLKRSHDNPVLPSSEHELKSSTLSAFLDGQSNLHRVTYHDALQRGTRIAENGAGVAEKQVRLQYTPLDQVSLAARYNSVDVNASPFSATHYDYNSLNQLTGIRHEQANAVDPPDYLYGYDRYGRINRMLRIDGTIPPFLAVDFTLYKHDNLNQLIAADHPSGAVQPADESYVYDDNGNRTNNGYQTSKGNRLSFDGTYKYEYDPEGNRTRRINVSTGEVTEYDWDHRNRLTRVTFKSAGGVITKQVNNGYDVFDRRIAQIVDADGAGPNAAQAKYFVYDGDHLLLAFDETGKLTNRYLHGPLVDQILADEQITAPGQAGTVYWPLTDHLGSVREVINSAGTIVNTIRYNAFGQIVPGTNTRAIAHR